MVAKVLEAKDTVMASEQILDKFGVTLDEDILNRDQRLEAVARAQAEVTFKVSQKAEALRIYRMAIGGSERMGSSNYWVKFKKSDWEGLVRKCSRCHRIREDDLESDICGSCADDLRQEESAES